MKRILALALGATAMAASFATSAVAGDYPWKPEKTITIVVPWSAGGATDQVTRVTAGELEKALGQKVVIVNQPGASGSIGKKGVQDGPHDGYTWAAGAPKQLGTYKLLGMFDTWVEDWRLYLNVTNVPMVSVNPDSPYQTMGELIEAMKANPGEISVATAGAGSSGHVAIEAIVQPLGLSYKHVSYDGGNPAVIATVSGETQVTTQLASEQAEMVRGKRLRPLAVVGDQAVLIDGYGEVPPITEWLKKVPAVATSFGIFIPKDAPAEVLKTFDMVWEQEIANSPALKKYAAEKGAVFTPVYGDAAQKRVMPEIQADAWSFHAAGRTKMSPEELGIAKPE
ncbi:Bug family tripartite tricarboxylate transporter substrate binding protein [Oceanibacterium hippocampi]|uniref:Tripartite tricarboxylate transporter family receptor n=1 Tax=Oceanibacterium hippocampi TaxID=745714 RepID=A0A1Y5RXI6_9PROT|nr:tripartite tricarboxylate transporter substrate binding protein [Oceanibacterium hippocampi]SLN27818.1 Tripartite tricarboxylate transporter family receptor [Oceanibacterium hippocampi]